MLTNAPTKGKHTKKHNKGSAREETDWEDLLKNVIIVKKAKKNCNGVEFIIFLKDNAVKSGPEENQVDVILRDFNLDEIWKDHKTGLDKDEEKRMLIKKRIKARKQCFVYFSTCTGKLTI